MIDNREIRFSEQAIFLRLSGTWKGVQNRGDWSWDTLTKCSEPLCAGGAAHFFFKTLGADQLALTHPDRLAMRHASCDSKSTDLRGSHPSQGTHPARSGLKTAVKLGRASERLGVFQPRPWRV
jgi:hypothetical protein